MKKLAGEIVESSIYPLLYLIKNYRIVLKLAVLRKENRADIALKFRIFQMLQLL